ncbi:uncharacterized protein LOC128998748 [Macrosteles quadrilineatus]|uniref:uncharacterized protein LOC128998748 n=1 Tax=Macrosteles quadrilineatus TaxID=74068 RepID=UPI0023E0FEF6|nr:uncharacterized protein LOC128998748 [Macrosteles quadrilineatus]
MVSNRCAMCLLCLASLVALSTQDIYANHRKRAELLQETFLPDHHFTNRDVRQSKFWSGSRYGRGGHDMPQPRLEVEPRGDRFFMGSRYGKRSTWAETEDGLVPEKVTCLYTGIVNFFRCTKFNSKITREDSEEDDVK